MAGERVEGGQDRASATKEDLESAEAGRGNTVVATDAFDHAVDLDDAEEAEDGNKVLDALASPWVVYLMFVLAILSCASSATIVLSVQGVAPFTLAGWRNQVNTLALLPAFLYQSSRLSKLNRRKALMPGNIWRHCVCSLTFAAHFGLYFWAVRQTSMTHCIFVTSPAPIFLAIFTLLTGGRVVREEVLGVALGAVGMAILASGTTFEENTEYTSPTYIGDFVSLCATAVFAIYLIVGKGLRSWMPLFVYQLPVVLGAAIVLCIFGTLFESSTSSGESHPFGWFRKEYLLGTVLLGVVPGAIGHSAYSYVLKFLPKLVPAMGIAVQPILGISLGWAFGDTSAPGLWTWVGGLLAIAATICVSISGAKHKEPAEAASAHASAHGPTSTENEAHQRSKSISPAIDDLDRPLLS